VPVAFKVDGVRAYKGIASKPAVLTVPGLQGPITILRYEDILGAAAKAA
jgi:hypothetical protein